MCSSETVRVCAMTSCSSRPMRLRSSARALSASPAWASCSCATRSICWRISRPSRTEKVTPAIQAPQPGSGWIHSHSTANRISAPAQYSRASRRSPVSAHHVPIRHTAIQPTSVEAPFPSTAIPAVATAAYASNGRRCWASPAPAPMATAAAAAAAAGSGFSPASPTTTSAVNKPSAGPAHPPRREPGGVGRAGIADHVLDATTAARRLVVPGAAARIIAGLTAPSGGPRRRWPPPR